MQENAGLRPALEMQMQAFGLRLGLNGECAFASLVLWGMHPLVILDPNSSALSGQVALRYMNKLDLQRVGSRSSNSWR